MFKTNDLWGAIGGALLLIFVYLILTNGGMPFATVISSTGSAARGLITGLQGRTNL